MIALKRGFPIAMGTIRRSVIGTGGDRTLIFALDGDSPARREDVVMTVSIDRLEGETAKDRRDGQIVAVGQMHDGRCHIRVAREGGEQMVKHAVGFGVADQEQRATL